jgi:hypothetical protein
MDIKSFISNLDWYSGPRSYFLFEALVLELIQKYLKDQSKPFFPHYKNPEKIEYDGFAPNGIDDLPGPAVIEVKLFRENASFLSLKRIFIKFLEDDSIKSILFVIGKNLTQNERRRILELFPVSSINIKIWDVSDLISLSHNYPESTSNSISELSESIFNNTVSDSLERSPDEWKVKNDKYVSRLKQSYKKNGLVLFLGSGISENAGIPIWNDLVYDLFVALIRNNLGNKMEFNEFEEDFIIEKLKEFNESSPLLQARYIRAGLGDSFYEVMSKVLYKNYKKSDTKTDLLRAISRICVARSIRSIVTYNFDDLLEEILCEAGLPFKPIYRDTDLPSQNELAINHVHGFLPENAENYDGLTESLLVFSEEKYHSLFQDPYSWSNIIQLNLLRENTCLMIGLSVIDPNLRRLLAISAKRIEEPKHYAILKKQKFEKLENTGIEIRDEALRVFANVNQELQEKTFEELGLNIIWVESYEEIPGILDSIRT